MKNKGFTLIELLAVIVILAIIALIATPIVLNIIKDSKNSSVERSAELYLSQLKNEIARYNMVHPGSNFNPSECIVQSDNTLNCDGTIIAISIDGTKPKSGSTILLSNGTVTSLKDFVMDGKNIVLVNGNCKVVDSSNKIICTGVESSTSYTTGTYGYGGGVSTKVPLGNYLPGDEYICQVNDSQTQHFIVMNTEGDKVNLLMTSNIDSTGTALTETTGTNERVRWNSTWDRTLGPVSAMELLNKATSSWTNIPMLNETYNDEGGNFTNYKITGRARLPKVSELKSLGDFACINYSNDDDRWYDGVYGYWTLSSSREYEHAAMVINNGCSVFINSGEIFGVRPVITLNKSNFMN